VCTVKKNVVHNKTSHLPTPHKSARKT